MSGKQEKPVWRMNIGTKGNFDIDVEFVFYRNGSIGSAPQVLGDYDFDWSIQGLWDDICFYKTNCTRKAKYRV